VVVEGSSLNYDDLELVEARPGLTDRDKTLRLRIGLGIFTICLMVMGPVLQYYYADIFLYILAAGIAFTIGTNLTIGILSVRIEDKAELMETRMTELLQQLSTSTEKLEEFNGQLAQFPLETMLVSMQEAREELTPTLASMQDISWGQVAQAINVGMEWYERVDAEKIGSLLSPFIREIPSVDLVDDPFVEDAEIDFFPPPPPRMRS
tara:strand:- start:62 stop:682 length:621 start_codon:yes stop_codon:yes gene_type:complete